MKARKFHTDKELKDNYPKPGVPADEAWVEMNRMLGAGVGAPPKPGKGPSITGVKKIFWQYTLVTAVVTATIWGYYRKHTVGKTSAVKTTLAHKNKIKNAQPFQYDSAKALDKESATPVDKGVTINDPVTKINLPVTDSGTQHTGNYTEKDNVTVSHSDSVGALLSKNKLDIPGIGKIDSGSIVYRNSTPKNNVTQIEKKIQYSGAAGNPAGKSFVHPGGATKNDNAGRGKRITNSKDSNAAQRIHHPLNLSNHNRLAPTGNTTLHSKNNTAVRRIHRPLDLVNPNRFAPTGNTTLHSKNNTAVRRIHHPSDLVNHNRLAPTNKPIHPKTDAAIKGKNHPLNSINLAGPDSINKYQLSEINTVEPSLPAGIISFIKEPISAGIPKNIRLDSEYLQKLNNTINSLALSKKRGIKSRDKIKETHTKSAIGFDYGLQWDAAIPVQGTTNYFKGTNGNSKPYNIILPQVWLSKGFSNNSKMFLKINVNQQYFAGNKQVGYDSISPPDSTFGNVFLSKTSGLGATLEYSYPVGKNWAASIGFNYTLNRNALLFKQIINFYSNRILGDSLYGIKRSSPEWRYINKSMVTGNLSLYYTFKKFDLGASLYVPFAKIPIYGNKYIRPVNAQLFLRWNLKKD